MSVFLFKYSWGWDTKHVEGHRQTLDTQRGAYQELPLMGWFVVSKNSVLQSHVHLSFWHPGFKFYSNLMFTKYFSFTIMIEGESRVSTHLWSWKFITNLWLVIGYVPWLLCVTHSGMWLYHSNMSYDCIIRPYLSQLLYISLKITLRVT